MTPDPYYLVVLRVRGRAVLAAATRGLRAGPDGPTPRRPDGAAPRGPRPRGGGTGVFLTLANTTC